MRDIGEVRDQLFARHDPRLEALLRPDVQPVDGLAPGDQIGEMEASGRLTYAVLPGSSHGHVPDELGFTETLWVEMTVVGLDKVWRIPVRDIDRNEMFSDEDLSR